VPPPRFHVDPVEGAPAQLALSKEESTHARRVLRLREGDAVVLFDGSNREWRGRIGGSEGGRTSVIVDAVERVDREPAVRLTVAVAPPKGKALEDLVRGLAELGVDAVRPMTTERSVVKLDAASGKLTRLRRAAIEASKQCGRNRITRIEDPLAFERVLADSGAFALRLVADTAGAPPLRDVLPGALASVLVLVGPEGGFSDAEIAAAHDAGFLSASLGRSICRVATACLACAAVLTSAVASGPDGTG
jgi:16S rRNA (uracil1498-N3)-methyltransferase